MRKKRKIGRKEATELAYCPEQATPKAWIGQTRIFGLATPPRYIKLVKFRCEM